MITLKAREFQGEQAPDWAAAVSRSGTRWFWEESPEQELGVRFFPVHPQLGYSARYHRYERVTQQGYLEMYLLPPLEDDPLPPVPDSVMYNAERGCRLEVATLPAIPANANYDVRLRIGVFSNTLVYQGKCTCLDPDSALQLAHDLRRMAMQIKREQKQQEGKSNA